MSWLLGHRSYNDLSLLLHLKIHTHNPRSRQPKKIGNPEFRRPLYLGLIGVRKVPFSRQVGCYLKHTPLNARDEHEATWCAPTPIGVIEGVGLLVFCPLLKGLDLLNAESQKLRDVRNWSEEHMLASMYLPNPWCM